MAINIEDQDQKKPVNGTPGNGKTLVGLLLMILGIGFLLQQLNYLFFPGWLFDWPLVLIVLGLFIGARKNFRTPAWFILGADRIC